MAMSLLPPEKHWLSLQLHANFGQTTENDVLTPDFFFFFPFRPLHSIDLSSVLSSFHWTPLSIFNYLLFNRVALFPLDSTHGHSELKLYPIPQLTSSAHAELKRASTQMIKNPPAMQETRVPPLGWEDPLEKGMATYSSIPAWELPWTEESGRLQSMRVERVGGDWATKHAHTTQQNQKRRKQNQKRSNWGETNPTCSNLDPFSPMVQATPMRAFILWVYVAIKSTRVSKTATCRKTKLITKQTPETA